MSFGKTSQHVTWQHLSKGALKSSSGLVLHNEGDFAIVQGTGDREGEVIRVKLAHLQQVDRVGTNVSAISKFQMGTPSSDQMTLINSWLPQGSPELTISDVVTIPFVAANNLVNRGLDAWDIDSLRAMASLLPGLPALKDHNWTSVDAIWGRIYSAELVTSATADSRTLARSGQYQNNLDIVKKNGFTQVVFNVYAPRDSHVVKSLQMGFGGNISTGGFRFTDYHCPICSTSFADKKCAHVPPNPTWGILPGLDESITEYAIRSGLYDMGEASLVVIPNLPAADII